MSAIDAVRSPAAQSIYRETISGNPKSAAWPSELSKNVSVSPGTDSTNVPRTRRASVENSQVGALSVVRIL